MAIDGGLRKIFKDSIPGQWTPVETGGTMLGVPDTEYCLAGGAQGWIEFKKCSTDAVKVRPAQVGWIERRVRMGGGIFVAVRRTRRGGDELVLLPGRAVRLLKTSGLTAASELAVGAWDGGPGRWDWGAIEKILRKN